MSVLVLLAHSDINRSIANRTIVDALASHDGIEVRNLNQLYPNYKINVAAEQAAVRRADRVVFQFPLHWYSVPGILKIWLDAVYERGFAHGMDGSELEGKSFFASLTVGGSEPMYQPGGFHNFTIEQLLAPLQQMSNYTGMRYQPALVSYDMVFAPGESNTREAIAQRARQHAESLMARCVDVAVPA
jgi:putative NADPH-quinone reductase